VCVFVKANVASKNPFNAVRNITDVKKSRVKSTTKVNTDLHNGDIKPNILNKTSQ